MKTSARQRLAQKKWRESSKGKAWQKARKRNPALKKRQAIRQQMRRAFAPTAADAEHYAEGVIKSADFFSHLDPNDPNPGDYS